MIEQIVVETDLIKLKFDKTPRTTSLTNDKFSLSLGGNAVESPFKEINTAEHYKSIARVLYLFFDAALTPNQVYTFTIDGVVDAAGKDLGEYTYRFRVGEADPEDPEPATPDSEIGEVIDDTSPEYTPSPSTDPPLPIEDHSIKKNVFLRADVLEGSNPNFRVVKTEPANGEVFLENDFERGRITVTFNQRPNPSFLNSQYIKVQKKSLTGIARWETLPIRISMDSYYPTIYIYVPSQDATPVYNTTGSDYFEDDYKYRVKISKEVGI